MEQARQYHRLGLFLMVSITIIVGVLLTLGGRKLFQPSFTFETYFDGSVAGLDIGSKVRYRGVPLGQVSEIVTSAAEYESNTPLAQRRNYIVVRAKVSISAGEVKEFGQDATQLIRLGLRAQMQPEGITGQQYVALEIMDPAKYPPLPFPWSPKYSYLPSAPSPTGEIIANIQQVLASLNQVDVKKLVENVDRLVLSLNSKVNQVPVGAIAAQMQSVLKSTDVAIAHVNAAAATPGIQESIENVAAITARLRQLTDSGDLDRTISHIDDTVARLNGLIGDNQYDLRVIVQDLRTTVENLRSLSATVKRYPAGALISGPPAKVQLPQDRK